MGSHKKRDPTADHKNTTSSSKQSLPFAQSYSRQVWFMPEGLGCFNKIATGARKRGEKLTFPLKDKIL